MPEYLLQTASTHQHPAFHRRRLADVLLPAGFDCEQVGGWGDFRIRCGTTEVALSAEAPGWQVSFDGPMPASDRERLMITPTRQIGQAVGEPCEWLQIA
jgi:hypothetical protein